MSFELIGKCSPTPDKIKQVVDFGFKKTELYMREEYFTDEYLKNIEDAKKEFGLEFYSVHTPHSKSENFKETIRKTKEFADKAGRPVIVIHSSYVNNFLNGFWKDMEPNMFIENTYNVYCEGENSLPEMEEALKDGAKICLDVAHLWVCSLRSKRNFYSDLETILRDYANNIGHIHIGDGAEGQKGLHNREDFMDDVNFQDGSIDFFTVMSLIKKYYKGKAICMETKPESQGRDKERYERLMKTLEQ